MDDLSATASYGIGHHSGAQRVSSVKKDDGYASILFRQTLQYFCDTFQSFTLNNVALYIISVVPNDSSNFILKAN